MAEVAFGKVAVTFTVNGAERTVQTYPMARLLDVLREELLLTGTKEGCEDSECGACMVLIDGKPLNSCSYLALQADGRSITTVEGLATKDELHPLQRAFLEAEGVVFAADGRVDLARCRWRPDDRG